MGARVIKIERPGAVISRAAMTSVRGLSSHFVWTNRSKESLTLDLKRDEAGEVMERLLTGADVLVQNLAPGAAARLGLSFEALHAKHPRLIVCDISGYGEGGPYQDKKAYDLLIQSESGFVSVTGTADGPSKAGCSIADIAAGMYAYSAILNALLLRGRTGEGSRIDVSMLESMVEWMGYPMYYAFDGAPPPLRGRGPRHHLSLRAVSRGRRATIMLGLQNEREWRVFCAQVLRQAELAEDPRFLSNSQRTANREALRTLIVDAFAGLDIDQVTQRLEDAQIANARVNDMAGVWAHPQLQARQRWREVGSPAGALPALLPPASNSAYAPRMDPVPAVGENTDAVLASLGYAPDEVARLHAAEVV